MQLPGSPSNPDPAGPAQASPGRVLGVAEIVSPTTVKCMGRTYRATAAGPGQIAITDVTDITHPTLLGTIRQPADAPGADLHPVHGRPLTVSGDLIEAIAVLSDAARASWWPDRQDLSPR